MSIEKTERVYHPLPLNRVAVPKVAEDNFSSRIAADFGQDEFRPSDALRIENKVKTQYLDGTDLDGDGVVSMREAILNSDQSAPDPNPDIDGAGKTQVEIIAADHSSFMLAQNSDQDGLLSLDALQIDNKVKDVLLGGADLDGDGVVSMREAIRSTKQPSPDQDLDMQVAQATTDAVVEMLLGDHSTSSEFYSQYIAELINSMGFSQANVRKLINQIRSDAGLGVQA
jgi:hypothetical protein